MRGTIAKQSARSGDHPKRAVLLAILVASSATVSAQQPRGGAIPSTLQHAGSAPLVQRNPYTSSPRTSPAGSVRSNPFFAPRDNETPAAVPAPAATVSTPATSRDGFRPLEQGPQPLGDMRHNQFVQRPDGGAVFQTVPRSRPRPLQLDARAARPIKPQSAPPTDRSNWFGSSEKVVQADQPIHRSRVVPVNDADVSDGAARETQPIFFSLEDKPSDSPADRPASVADSSTASQNVADAAGNSNQPSAPWLPQDRVSHGTMDRAGEAVPLKQTDIPVTLAPMVDFGKPGDENPPASAASTEQEITSEAADNDAPVALSLSDVDEPDWPANVDTKTEANAEAQTTPRPMAPIAVAAPPVLLSPTKSVAVDPPGTSQTADTGPNDDIRIKVRTEFPPTDTANDTSTKTETQPAGDTEPARGIQSAAEPAAPIERDRVIAAAPITMPAEPPVLVDEAELPRETTDENTGDRETVNPSVSTPDAEDAAAETDTNAEADREPSRIALAPAEVAAGNSSATTTPTDTSAAEPAVEMDSNTAAQTRPALNQPALNQPALNQPRGDSAPSPSLNAANPQADESEATAPEVSVAETESLSELRLSKRMLHAPVTVANGPKASAMLAPSSQQPKYGPVIDSPAAKAITAPDLNSAEASRSTEPNALEPRDQSATFEQQQEPDRPVLHLTRGQVRSMTVGGRLRRVTIADRDVCQAFPGGSNQIKLIGTGLGRTTLTIWADVKPDEATRKQTFEIEISEAVNATGEKFAEHTALLNESIDRAFPRASVVVSREGGELVVTGRCDDEATATQIIRMVRKSCLVPVRDQLRVR